MDSCVSAFEYRIYANPVTFPIKCQGLKIAKEVTLLSNQFRIMFMQGMYDNKKFYKKSNKKW